MTNRILTEVRKGISAIKEDFEFLDALSKETAPMSVADVPIRTQERILKELSELEEKLSIEEAKGESYLRVYQNFSGFLDKKTLIYLTLFDNSEFTNGKFVSFLALRFEWKESDTRPTLRILTTKKWQYLTIFSDVFARLGKHEGDLSPENFLKMLKELGFEDYDEIEGKIPLFQGGN